MFSSSCFMASSRLFLKALCDRVSMMSGRHWYSLCRASHFLFRPWRRETWRESWQTRCCRGRSFWTGVPAGRPAAPLLSVAAWPPARPAPSAVWRAPPGPAPPPRCAAAGTQVSPRNPADTPLNVKSGLRFDVGLNQDQIKVNENKIEVLNSKVNIVNLEELRKFEKNKIK